MVYDNPHITVTTTIDYLKHINKQGVFHCSVDFYGEM